MDHNRALLAHSSLDAAAEKTPFPDLDEGLPQRIAYIGSDGICRLANRAFLEWCGRSIDQVLGAPISEVMSADEHAAALPLIERALSGSMVRHQHEVIKANGGKDLRDILVVPHRAGGSAGLGPDGCFWISADVSRRSEDRDRHDRFECDRNAILERVAAGADVEIVMALMTNAVEDRFPGAWINIELGPNTALASPVVQSPLVNIPIVLDPGRAVGSVMGSLMTSTGHGDRGDEQLSFRRALESTAQIAALAMARHDLCVRLAYQAQHDELTGLPNRRLFEEHLRLLLADARRRATRMALVVIDLDDFKRINDALGHAAGDQLLRSFVTRLSRFTRQGDLLARAAGDEFVLLLRDLPDGIEAREIAVRLCDQLNKEPLQLGETEVHLHASFGVSHFPEDGSDVATLLRSADLAMSRAKQLGKERVETFTPNLTLEASDRLDLESALRRALARNELSLHLQPQVNLATGRVVSYEALCRWSDPQLGVISPFRFIRCAEETGLIVPLGHWVIEEACRHARALRSHGHSDVRVAINVSGAQFLRGDLVDRVAHAMRANELAPGQLELELTESVLMRETSRMAAELSALRSLGARLAIDDFGTGYSSLSYLQHLPMDAIKIDQSFIRGIGTGTHGKGGELVRSIIHLGHSLGLELIAEGVETHEQAAWLEGSGCELAQGYWYGRPAPLSRFLTEQALAAAAFGGREPLAAGDVDAPLLEEDRAPRRRTQVAREGDRDDGDGA